LHANSPCVPRIGHGALAGAYLLWASVPGSGASRAQLIHVIDHMNSSPALALIFPLFIAFPVALLATYVAAVQAHRAPRWVLAAAAAALACAIVQPLSDRVGASAALVCLIAATGLARRRAPGARLGRVAIARDGRG